MFKKINAINTRFLRGKKDRLKRGFLRVLKKDDKIENHVKAPPRHGKNFIYIIHVGTLTLV
jgi:hypothetical protein